jgi:hypothetical protein
MPRRAVSPKTPPRGVEGYKAPPAGYPRAVRIARPHVTTALAVGAVAVAGCSKAPEPAAPKTTVDNILSSIAKTCGSSLELHEFGAPAQAAHAADARASAYGSQLLGIWRRAPKATYLGQSMTRVLDTEASDARKCGLPATARLIQERR